MGVFRTHSKIYDGAFSEATIGGVLWKKVFLKILQFSRENTSVGVSFE